MECSSGLGGIGLRNVCRGRMVVFEKVFVKCVGNLGTIIVENGPENIQSMIFENFLIDLPHRRHNSAKTCKQQGRTKMDDFIRKVIVTHCGLASAQESK